MLRAFLMVGIGGFFGSMARYGVSYISNKYIVHNYPFATFIVNVVGCFLIGLLFGLGQKHVWFNTNWYLLLAGGFCGGFTTFSSFALENILLIEKQQFGMALLYTALSVVVGLIVCKLGMSLVTQ